jgi:hypothetical protein
LRERVEVAILALRLALGQFSDHKVAIALEFFVSRTREGQRASRKIMSAGKVAAQFAVGFFPITQWLSRRSTPGLTAESVKQSVGGKCL